ncbi:MAG: 2-hydroxyacyl-CoA dehydratase family protein [Pseudomonadota bacterium]
MTTKVTAPGKKILQSTLEISKAMRSYYGDVKEAHKAGKPIIWNYGLVPREIYAVADAPVIYLEHLPMLLGAKQLSGRYIQIAEQEGLSRDVCAFHRCFLGCAIAEERDPYLEKLFVPPDLIIATNYPCLSESKSFLYTADQYNCPYHFLDVPINTWGKDIPEYAINYLVEELKKMIEFLEEHGYKVDMDKLKESVALTKKMMGLWEEIDDCRKSVPSPISVIDGMTASYPLIQLPGTQQGVTIFENLLAELKERVARKEGAIEDEKLRLMWFGVPPLYNMGLLNYVEQYGAVVVKSTVEYVAGGGFDYSILDPEKPLESIAHKTLVDIINPTAGNIVDFLAKAAKDYKIDGVVGVVKRTCGLLPGYMRLVKDSIYNESGIPTTIFDLDGLDIREYDDANTKANLDSFIEALLGSKRRN